MHAGFQFVFSSFLPQRFAGSASMSCIFEICRGLEFAPQSPRLIPVFSTSPGELRALLLRRVTEGRQAARAESNQRLMKRAVTLAKPPPPNW